MRESVTSRVLLFRSSLTDIDACVSHPCVNGGTCVLEDGNTFECKCQSHNRGPRCEGAELLFPRQRSCAFLLFVFGLILFLLFYTTIKSYQCLS